MNMRVIIAIVVAVAVLAVAWFTWQGVTRSRVPVIEPPVIAVGENTDPAVRQLIEESLANVRNESRSADAWMKLGLVYSANSHPKAAIACFQQAAELRTTARTLYHLALAHEQTGEIESAIAAIDRAIAIDPSYAPLHWRKGLWQLDLGATDSSLAAFLRATELNPADSLGWIGLARVQLLNGEPNEAVESLERARRQETGGPNAAYVHQLLAVALQQLNQQELAEQHRRRGQGAEPNYSDIWQADVLQYRLGFASQLQFAGQLADAGNLDGAVLVYQRLLEQKPEDPTLLHQFGSTVARQGRFADAVTFMSKAAEIMPSDPSLHLDLSIALAQRARSGGPSAPANTEDMNLALRHIERVIELDPDNGRASGLRGDFLAVLGRFDQAIESWLRAFELEPGNPLWLIQPAKVYITRGQWTEALALLERLTTSFPQHGESHLLMGITCTNLGRFDQAQTALDRAAALRPNDSLVGSALLDLQKRRNTPGVAPPSGRQDAGGGSRQ